MAHKTKVGAVHKQNGATTPATHFYHSGMRRIYKTELKPHFEKVFADLASGKPIYVPKSASHKAR